MIHSNYSQEENILYIERTGEVPVQELFILIQETVSNFRDLKCLYILDQSRGSTPQFSSSDYPDLVKRIGEGLVHFLEVRHAIFADSPMNTALGVLFEEIANELENYTFKTFISEASAKAWLKEGVHYRNCPPSDQD